ncbi:hypothetical protein N779_09370 [Vibrio coralliilyticus OCN008]|nr:hypothetical protein N779_09370 [Vibrio coralliilyticus OCN008]
MTSFFTSWIFNRKVKFIARELIPWLINAVLYKNNQRNMPESLEVTFENINEYLAGNTSNNSW